MIFLILPVLFILLELLRPRKKYKFLKKGIALDFFWYFGLQTFIVQLFVFKFLNRFVDSINLELLSHQTIAVQFLIFLMGMDFLDYWLHRLSHNWWVMWRMHEVHHTTLQLNWLSGSRQHFIEVTLIQVLFGIIPTVLGVDERVLYMFGISSALMGMFNHSNLKVKIGPLKYIFNSPEMHSVHHLNDMKYQNCNYANKFILWDWIFGTAKLPPESEIKDREYGIGYEYPQDFLGQLTYLFRKRENDTEEELVHKIPESAPSPSAID